MGTYPVPIKSESIRQLNINPIIFQCYKTFWVFITGICFLIPRFLNVEDPVYVFNWWAVLSAACWIPSGLCTILSVQLIGVSMAIVLNTSSAALLSFLVFWLVVGEKLKKHDVSGHSIYFAPIYLFLLFVGMVGLVFSPRIKIWTKTRRKQNNESTDRFRRL
eukprot:UN31267